MRARPRQQEAMAQQSFERWLFHRVARAVERGDLSGDLLVELQTEIAVGRVRSQDAGPAGALRRIADLLEADQAATQDALADSALDPAVGRERLLREVAENWLADQTERYRRKYHG